MGVMGTVTAKGFTRFVFHGTPEVCRVVLDCGTTEAARDVARALGGPWRVGTVDARAVVASMTRTDVDAFASRHSPACPRCSCGKTHGWQDLAHSVDYGPEFRVTIEVTPGEQATIPGVSP